MYDPALVEPMRRELTVLGVEEMRTAAEVDKVLTSDDETVLVVVNSVCGCAAAHARPGVALALQHDKLPKKVATVFAGQDLEATAQARRYFKGYFPTSPQIALMKKGEVAFMLERYDIEGRTAQDVARRLVEAFDEHCG
ncbi:MAG: BrxA/BrxB family bacilliredoxin [candidate division Zixibacteria bacterium]|nr:BrxA/BrxB family bacilliredoxin [candidate division Zixibacteria bacterium]